MGRIERKGYSIKRVHIRISIYLALLLGAVSAQAGNLDNAGAPTAGSGMPTLQGIYDQLTTGTAATVPGSFSEATSGATTGVTRTLAEISAKLPVPDNSNGATASEVLQGKFFWGLRTDGTWGIKAGTVAAGDTVTGGPGSLIVTIPNGLYSGATTAMTGDANLVSANIKSGANIFGMNGASAVVDTSGGTATASDITAGKIAYVNGAMRTGTLSGGGYACTGTLSALGRWCDNGNGTVRDMSTGLLWLKNANCAGTMNWYNADVWSSGLATGACGLSDSSTAGTWRLPTQKEFLAIANGTEPVSPTTLYKFSSIAGDTFYWLTGTGVQYNPFIVFPDRARCAVFFYTDGSNAYIIHNPKGKSYYVWPIRAGQ